MRRTTRKFALTSLCYFALQGISTVATAGLCPEVISDRQAPGMCGPAQLTFDYSDKYGFVTDPRYVNNIGPYDALMLEIAFGAQEFRGAMSWGHALTHQHYIKLSAEYLAQEPEFDFIAGVESQWIGQKGAGVEYSYNPDQWHGIHDIHFGVNYFGSKCESLDNVAVTGGTNIRHIASATNWGATLGFSAEPWEGSFVRVDVHHDSVKFETKNILNRSLVGVGATVLIEQLFANRYTIALRGSDRQAFYEYSALMSTLVDTAPGTRIEVFCGYSLTGGPGVQAQRENRYSLGVFYSWGGDKYGPRATYRKGVTHHNTTERIVQFTNRPAIRAPQVIAIEDQKVV